MSGCKQPLAYTNTFSKYVTCGVISKAHGETEGMTLNFTYPVLFIFSKVLFGFAAWTLNRRLLGTPRLLFGQCVFLAEAHNCLQYIRR